MLDAWEFLFFFSTSYSYYFMNTYTIPLLLVFLMSDVIHYITSQKYHSKCTVSVQKINEQRHLELQSNVKKVENYNKLNRALEY